jgi:hypothetical protein
MTPRATTPAMAGASPPGAIEQRGPLRLGKVFVTDGERAATRGNLEAAHRALAEAWDLWQERDRTQTWDYGYWDEDDVYGLESATLHALGAAEHAWKALISITDAHEAQLTAADDTEHDADGI